MVDNKGQNVLNIGFLGFGEVGYTFANGLKAVSNCRVFAFDNNQDNEWKGKLIHDRAQETGVTLVSGPETLVNNSDIVFGIVPAKFTINAASTLQPFLKTGKAYCDLGSAPPVIKREVETLVISTGAEFLDGAIMGSMPLYGFQAPIIISGNGADAWSNRLKDVGFNINNVGDKVGVASSTKMLRSVFTKGYEALVVETFYAASRLGVEDVLLESLANTFDQEKFAESVSRYITSDAIHAERRAGEVEGVQKVLSDIGVEPIMTTATKSRLLWTAGLKLNEQFQGVAPEDPKIVLKAMIEADSKDI